MAWLHTWTGLVTGWILFFVFVTGTAGYVDDEITRWMQPELPLSIKAERRDDARTIDLALKRLEQVAPNARKWTINLPHYGIEPRGEQGLSIAWQELPRRTGEFGLRGRENLDATTGQVQPEIEPRATGGGRTLYRMHYLLRYMPSNVAIMLVGMCTMLMLLAVITGVITHKKIFSDFFTFRPRKGQRSWLDAHNVVSVMSLPFFLMITYTGLVFFAFNYMPAARDTIFSENPRSFFRELRGLNIVYEPVTPPRISLSQLKDKVENEWRYGAVSTIELSNPKGQTPFVEFLPAIASGVNLINRQGETYSAVDGTKVERSDLPSGAANARGTLVSLHEGNFANWWLRWLYFISGLLGCAVIGTGLVLWTVKRRTQHQKRSAKAGDQSLSARFDAAGLRLVEILNAGTLAGLPLGVAGYFWANRLLPVAIAERASWEVNVLFILWGWALLYASVRPLKKAWIELLYATVAAYALIPLLNWATTDKHLGNTLPHGDWALAGFDLTMLALAAIFFYMALKLKRKWLVLENTLVKPIKPAKPEGSPILSDIKS